MTDQQREARPENVWCIKYGGNHRVHYLLYRYAARTRRECIDKYMRESWDSGDCTYDNKPMTWERARRIFDAACVKVTITEGWGDE